MSYSQIFWLNNVNFFKKRSQTYVAFCKISRCVIAMVRRSNLRLWLRRRRQLWTFLILAKLFAELKNIKLYLFLLIAYSDELLWRSKRSDGRLRTMLENRIAGMMCYCAVKVVCGILWAIILNTNARRIHAQPREIALLLRKLIHQKNLKSLNGKIIKHVINDF